MYKRKLFAVVYGKMEKEELRWRSQGYNILNDVAAQREQSLKSIVWYHLFNVSMRGLLIAYERWTNSIDAIVKYTLTHGIPIRVYDATTLFSTKLLPICNMGKIPHVNQLPTRELVLKKKHLRWVCHPELETISNKYGRVSQVVGWRGFCTTLNQQDVIKEIYHIYDIYLKAAIAENKAAFRSKVKRTVEKTTVEELLPLGQLFEKQVILERIALFAEQYSYKEEVLSASNPFESREALVQFGREWSSFYQLDYPEEENEAIANAITCLYYIMTGIEPCRERVPYETLSLEELARVEKIKLGLLK